MPAVMEGISFFIVDLLFFSPISDLACWRMSLGDFACTLSLHCIASVFLFLTWASTKELFVKICSRGDRR